MGASFPGWRVGGSGGGGGRFFLAEPAAAQRKEAHGSFFPKIKNKHSGLCFTQLRCIRDVEKPKSSPLLSLLITLKTAAQERKERRVARKSYRRASIYTKIINNTDGDNTTDEDDDGGGGEGDGDSDDDESDDAGNDSG